MFCYASPKGRIDLFDHTQRKMRQHEVSVGDNYGWSICVCAYGHVSFVWKSLSSNFCGQTEGSGKVDHIQLIMSLCLQQLMDHWERGLCVCECA